MKSEQYIQISYLVKVVTGILLVISICTAAFLLPESNFSDGLNLGVTGMLILFFIVLFPVVYLIYRRMDELQRRLHEHASVFTITLLVSISGALGVLQANQIIPLFNQVWTLGIAIVIWATALSFFDKFYK